MCYLSAQESGCTRIIVAASNESSKSGHHGKPPEKHGVRTASNYHCVFQFVADLLFIRVHPRSFVH